MTSPYLRSIWWSQSAAGGSGGGVENPMTADLDVGGFDIIGSPAPDAVSSGGNVEILGGIPGVSIAAFNGADGKVTIRSADNPSTNSFVETGEVRIEGGDATGAGSNNAGARVAIFGGEGIGNGPGGNVVVQAGKNRGSNIALTRVLGAAADTSSDLAGNVQIIGGQGVSPGIAGDVQIRPGDGGLDGTFGIVEIGDPTQNIVSNGEIHINGVRVDNGGGASVIGSDVILRGGFGIVSTPASHGHVYIAPPALNDTTNAEAPTELRFLETRSNGGNFTALRGAAAQTADTIWTLPDAQQISGQVMGIDLGEFTVAGLPAAASYPNCHALATNAVGGRTVVRSDGTNWKIVAVEGATVT